MGNNRKHHIIIPNMEIIIQGRRNVDSVISFLKKTKTPIKFLPYHNK